VLLTATENQRQRGSKIDQGCLGCREAKFKHELICDAIRYEAMRLCQLRSRAEFAGSRKTDRDAGDIAHRNSVPDRFGNIWPRTLSEWKIDQFGFFQRRAFGQLDREIGWQVTGTIKPGRKWSRLSLHGIWTEDNSEWTNASLLLGTALPQARAPCRLIARLCRIGNPEQLQVRVGKEEAPILRALSWVYIAGTFAKTASHQRIGFRCARSATDEYVIQFKSHFALIRRTNVGVLE
jgi:hypothetical protein